MKTKITTWHGCYDGNLKGLIVPEAFAHPAKMSRVLCERIFDHGKEKGYWQPGDTIIDPFGGIGTTALIGAYRGYQVVSIELEARFHDLALQNRDKNRKNIKQLGNPLPIFIKGDSRDLINIVEGGKGAITSPPFLQSKGGQPEPKEGGTIDNDLYARHAASNKATPAYGDADGQVQNFPEGDHTQVVGGISSPPYANMPTQKNSGSINLRKQFEMYRNHGGGQSFEKFETTQKKHSQGYGDNPDQLGHFPEGEHGQVVGGITSPPWNDHLSADRPDPKKRRELARKQGISNAEHVSPIDFEREGLRDQKYGNTEGQIGEMPTGAITSPPYEDSVNSTHSGIDWDKAGRPERNNPSNSRQAVQAAGLDFSYGKGDAQIGAQSGDTYWSACALIYQQVFQLLPPGGAFAVVVKDFVRNKKRVPLCDQTAELLQAIGFDIPERIRAMLVKEVPQTIDMFTGDASPRLIERKSFFRRLAEKKGSPRIDWEEVIWAIKP